MDYVVGLRGWVGEVLQFDFLMQLTRVSTPELEEAVEYRGYEYDKDFVASSSSVAPPITLAGILCSRGTFVSSHTPCCSLRYSPLVRRSLRSDLQVGRYTPTSR